MTGVSKNLNDNIDFTKTQLGVLLGIIFLSVDTINPVKIFLHVFPAVAPWHIATICMLLSLYIWISEFKALLYFSVKIFFHSILSIFFRDVEIVGIQRTPRHGPIIYTINHANQFMDAVMVLCTAQNKISYLMADHSYKRRLVGDLAWALDVVPVKRPQDSAIVGCGKVCFFTTTTNNKQQQQDSDDDSNNNTNNSTSSNKVLSVEGYENSKFTTQFSKGDKIRPTGTPAGAKVIDVIDDTHMLVDINDIPTEEVEKVFSKKESKKYTYDIMKRVDQKVVYEKVLDKLASGGCIGIFPEGGSHDRTDLLPLKVGVALIAYSALEKDGVNVPIVPVGLNYFSAHRWRGRAVVEYGDPIYIDPSTLKQYKAGGPSKREVCNNLLDRIQDGMRSVIVSAPDYDTLLLIHTARRLYQRRGLQAKEKQDMARRFAEGYKMLMLMVQGDPPQAWLDLQKRVVDYQQELRDLGIRDYQVPGLDREKAEIAELGEMETDEILKEVRLQYQIVHLLVLLALAAIPVLFLNLPVGILAGIYSERRRAKALAKSKVKVKGFDVMLTEKVVFCIVAIPTLWFIYFLIFYFCTDFDGPKIALCLLSMPLFAYVGIIVSDAGMVEVKDLRPYVMRLFPSTRRRLKKLPAIRKQLQVDMRAFIKKVGPALGEIYYGKQLDWKQIQEKSRKITSHPELIKKHSSIDDLLSAGTDAAATKTPEKEPALSEENVTANKDGSSDNKKDN